PRENTSLLGGGSNWHGWGGGAVDFGSSDFAQTILGEAVNVAGTKVSIGVLAEHSHLQRRPSPPERSAGVVGGKSHLEARAISVEGLLAAVDGGQVVVNVGAKAALKVGDQL